MSLPSILQGVIPTAIKTVQGGVNDAASDISGLLGLPKLGYTAITNPKQGGQILKNAVTGLASNANDEFGQPINPQTLQPQVPNLQEAGQSWMQHPLNNALNLIPAAKLITGGKDMAEAGNIANVANTAKNTGFVSEGMRASGQAPAMGFVSKAPSIINKAEAVPDTAASLFMKPYVIRSEVAKDINVPSVAKQMVNDGITGQTADVDNKVQSLLNKTEEIKGRALANTKTPIDMTNTEKQITDGLLGDGVRQPAVPELAGNTAKANSYKQTLEAYLPQTRDIEGNVNALDAYDSMKKIRNLGYDMVDQGQDVYGKTINAEKVNVGKLYIDVANEMNDQIDKTLGDAKVFDQVKTPQDIQALSQISPQFGQRIAQQGLGWKDFQGLQKPYVNMSSILKETKRAANTPGAKFTGQITDAISKTAGGSAGMVMGGPMGAMAGFMGGQVASPFIQAAADKILPGVMSGAANLVNNVSKAGISGLGLPSKSTVGLAGEVGDKAATPPTPASTTPEANPNGQNFSSATNNGVISKQGRYSLDTPQSKGLLTTNDYTNQDNALTQQLADAQSSGDTVTATRIAGQQKQLQDSYTNQKPLRDAFTSSNKIIGLGNAAYNLIAKAPLSVANLNGGIDGLLKSTNPQYQALGAALQNIQNTTHVNLSSAKTKEALAAGLDQAINVAKNNYYAQEQEYFGGNSLNTGAAITEKTPVIRPTMPPSPTGQLGQPVNYNFDFGSAGQNMPTGLPPLPGQ